MSDQHDTPAQARIEQLNSDLVRGLDRCRALLDDCRSKLAANSNEPHVLAGSEHQDESRSG